MSKKNRKQSALSLTRRNWLLAAGGLGVGALALPSLSTRVAQANGGTPKRLLIVTSHHQIMPSAMLMNRGNPSGSPFEYRFSDVANSELSDCLAPLAAYKDRLTVVQGMSLATGMPNSGYTNNHDTSHGNLLTAGGLDLSDESAILGASVDQIIADEVRDPARIRSLEFGGRLYNGGMVAFGQQSRAPVETSPQRAYERLFAQMNEEPAEPSERDLIEASRSKMLDALDRQYAKQSTKLSSEDRLKLELHREYLADLNRQLEGLSGLECSAPTPEGWQNSSSPITTGARQFGALTAAAFACDMTRVATIQMNQLSNSEFGAGPGDVHQDFAHQSSSSDSAEAEMRKYNARHGQVLGEIVEELARYSDSSGSLLDNTLVLWLSEHGVTRDAHTMREHAAVMIGNLGGYFDVGRYINLPRETLNPKEGGERIGVPHSHLLVSLAQGMGLSRDAIGANEYVTDQGNRVSLTGPMTQLRA